MAEGGRSTRRRRRHRTAQPALVVSQLALSFVLLIGAALMLRSFVNLHARGRRLPRRRTSLTAQRRTSTARSYTVRRATGSTPSRSRPSTGSSRSGCARRADVVAVGPAWTFPLKTRFRNDGDLHRSRAGRGTPASRAPSGTSIGVSPAYFRRHWRARCCAAAPSRSATARGRPRVIVNQRLARRHSSIEDPLGRRLSGDDGRTWRTIVGVVGDVRQQALDQEPSDTVYLPFTRVPGLRLPPSSCAPSAIPLGPRRRSCARPCAARDPQTPVTDVRTLEDIRGEAALARRD